MNGRIVLLCGLLGLLALAAAAQLYFHRGYEPVQAVRPESSEPSAEKIRVRDSLAGDRGRFFDLKAGRAFERELSAEERARLVKLKSRFVLPQPKEAFEPSGEAEQVLLQVARWLKPAEKAAWQAQGVTLGGPFSGRAYRAKLDPGAWERIKHDPLVAGAAPIRNEDKLPQTIYRMVERRMPGPLREPTVRVAVEWMPGAKANAQRLLAPETAAAIKGTRGGCSLLNLTPNEIARVAKLADVAYVHYVGLIPETTEYDLNKLVQSTPRPKPAPGTSNEDAQVIHGVDILHSLNIFGFGVSICEVDGGQVLATHQALTGRVTDVETTYAVDDHATHVCGTMIAEPPTSNGAQGMAPQARVFSYNFYGTGDSPAAFLEPEEKPAHAKANHTCVTCNNSWGYVGGAGQSPVFDETVFGDYDFFARVWDEAAEATNMVICKASGNDRNDSAAADGNIPYDGHDGTFFATAGLTDPYYDCISNWGCSKNVLTVGAATDAPDFTVGDYSSIAGFSSIGPADDGRIKPDVVANGDNLFSTGSASDSAYVFKSGTSMATPVTTGITALLIEDFRSRNGNANPDAMLIKGTLIHTARDLGPAGPDYVFGYGLVDADAALTFLRSSPQLYLKADVDDGTTNTFTIDIPPAAPDLKFTLLWMDPAGSSGSLPAIVNNLDLEIQSPDTTIYHPFSLDGSNPPAAATTATANSVDTVEQIVIAAPVAGTWTVRVKGTAVPSGPQTYYLLGGVNASTLIAPSMSAPSSPTYSLKPTFSWTPVAGATQYELRVDDLTTSTQNVLFKTDVSGTSHAFTTALTVAHDYRARVRARTLGGVTGPWSSYLTFTVQKLTAPTVLTPLGTVTVTSPTHSWSAVTGADTYDVLVRFVGGGSTVYATTSVTGTSLILPVTLTKGLTYETVVTAKNASGNVSDASSPGVFTVSIDALVNQPGNGNNYYGGGGGTSGGGGGSRNGRNTQTPPNIFGPNQPQPRPRPRANQNPPNNQAESVADALNMPVPAAPSGEIAEAKPAFSWSKVAGADAYDLFIVDVTDEGDVKQVLLTLALTENAFTPKEPLPAGRKYRFLVRATAKSGAYSQVAPMDFNVKR
ncbi:MAG: S8 family serine peptidase [Planctomycetota bacterium]|nr:S8 family serine peptidase [Planctomycetota bacterium]